MHEHLFQLHGIGLIDDDIELKIKFGQLPELNEVKSVNGGRLIQTLPELYELWLDPTHDSYDTWLDQLEEAGKISPEDDWKEFELTYGLGWIEADNTEQYVPQAFGFEAVGGISFNKGCYTGQEIISRLHYKGTSKKGVNLVACESPLATEQEVFDHQGKSVGKVFSAAQGDFGWSALLIANQETLSEPLFADQNQSIAVNLLSLKEL